MRVAGRIPWTEIAWTLPEPFGQRGPILPPMCNTVERPYFPSRWRTLVKTA
jgi:hypothetical protein